MDFTERRGGDLEHLIGIANASFCNEECRKNTNCSVWTYLDGRCYLKNENTFSIKTDGLVSGITNCTNDGMHFFISKGTTYDLCSFSNSRETFFFRLFYTFNKF